MDVIRLVQGDTKPSIILALTDENTGLPINLAAASTNVYIKFRTEEDAAKAVADLNNRWFGGRPIYAELSPVTDFREACCRKSIKPCSH